MDTNVVVAGVTGFRRPFVPGRNASADLLHEWVSKDRFRWLLSEAIVDEYKAVLERLGVRRGVVGTIVNVLRSTAEWVEGGGTAGVSPDPGDDIFCACADEGEADFLVTLNVKDFPQHRLRARVVTPSAFLRR